MMKGGSSLKRFCIRHAGRVYLQHVYRRHLHVLATMREQQERLFQLFQRRLAGTALAQDTGLLDYATHREFISSIPPQPYDFYEPYVRRLCAGEPSVMYHGATEYFFVTSGTSGFNRKLIPCNAPLRRTILLLQKKVLATVVLAGRGVHLSSDRLAYGTCAGLEPVNGVRREYISGIFATLIPAPLREYVVPPPDALREPDWETCVAKIVDAARPRDIRLISGVPAYLVHVLRDMVEQLGAANLREVWPNLSTCVYSGTTIQPHDITLNQLVGCDLNYIGGYVASEGPLGFEVPGITPRGGHMCLLPDAVLYSFQDMQRSNAPVLSADELQAGGEYLIHIGTPNGMTHYAIHDYIRVTATHPVLIFELQGRCGTAINAATEKVTETQVKHAVRLLRQTAGVAVEHFFVYPGKNPAAIPCYHWIFATDALPDNVSLPGAIDLALMQIAPDYREARMDNAVLARPVVQCMPASIVRRAFHRHRHGGQFKMKTSFPDKAACDAYLTDLLLDEWPPLRTNRKGTDA